MMIMSDDLVLLARNAQEQSVIQEGSCQRAFCNNSAQFEAGICGATGFGSYSGIIGGVATRKFKFKLVTVTRRNLRGTYCNLARAARATVTGSLITAILQNCFESSLLANHRLFLVILISRSCSVISAVAPPRPGPYHVSTNRWK
jgi:hypothetical protein